MRHVEGVPPARRLRLLLDQSGPDGAVIPAGTELVVDAAEARTLLGAIGLAEDLGEHVEIPEDPSRGDAGEGGDDSMAASNASAADATATPGDGAAAAAVPPSSGDPGEGTHGPESGAAPAPDAPATPARKAKARP